MHLYRRDWMQRLLLRENRIADANVIGNLERNASFFASSTLIILAGILTALGASDRAVSLLADLPFAQPVSRGLSEIKLLCLAVVFVYAFFTFSWCMRQYNFAAVLVASAPMVGSVTSAIRSAELSPIGLHGSSPWRPTSSTSACAPTISAWRRWPGLSIRGFHACHRWRGAHPLSPGVSFRRARGDGIHANFADRIAQGIGALLARRYHARPDPHPRVRMSDSQILERTQRFLSFCGTVRCSG